MVDLTKRTWRATVKVLLTRALFKSLRKDLSLPNGQVFHLRFGVTARVDPTTKKVLGVHSVRASFHFGHASQRTTFDEPLLFMNMDRNQWPVVLANVDEINSKIEEAEV